MKYAVIRTQGRQYKVGEKEEILVGKIDGKPELEVLIAVDGDRLEIGTPVAKNSKVSVKSLGSEKGEKIQVRKYKAKSRYRKTIGFRPSFTRLLIEKITVK